MAKHILTPSKETLHGYYSPGLAPVLHIEPGDSVVFETLDAGWGNWWEGEDDLNIQRRSIPKNDPAKDKGPALCGPVYIKGAKPGMTLAVSINSIVPGTWGFSGAGGWTTVINERTGVAGKRVFMKWRIDKEKLKAADQFGRSISITPFMGTMGMPMASPSMQNSIHPQFTGGNLDCKELVAGTKLYLPVAVEGGLFSTGDGHAAQGDGEVSGIGLECPMQEVDLAFDLLDASVNYPVADTPKGWITFGFHEELEEATLIALNNMVQHMMKLYSFTAEEALSYSSLVVDLHISQIVNGVKAVHAMLPHDCFAGLQASNYLSPKEKN